MSVGNQVGGQIATARIKPFADYTRDVMIPTEHWQQGLEILPNKQTGNDRVSYSACT